MLSLSFIIEERDAAVKEYSHIVLNRIKRIQKRITCCCFRYKISWKNKRAYAILILHISRTVHMEL
ncbi:hypothetical protein HMPREF9163_00067 [Selenomonas sp. oral taxon 138 str. F0429]|nr:hypothetical protein HMPREF9163_00067 [Selenomonas sp. oral taxon 138 str. F0429]